MRILHVAYVYPPKPNVADGITNAVYNLTQELARRGHEVTVYTSDMLDLHGNGSIEPTYQIINRVKVYYLESFWRHKTSIVTPSIIHLLSKNISNFDIVHIHDCRSFQGIYAYFFAKVKKVPYVFQPHGSYLFSLLDSTPKRLAKIALDKVISNRVVMGSSKIIALSEVEAEQCRKAGIPNEKIAIVSNGIDLSEYDNLPSKGSFRRRFNINKEDKIVLFLGRIHKIKGVDILVKAFADIVKKMGRVRLVIAGPDDGFLPELKTLIAALKIENNVLIVGPLYGRNKLEAYVDADVYVLPSRYETFPMSILEALACGTPIILTENCGIASYFKEKVGLLVRPEPSSIYEALLEMLTTKRMGEFRKNCKNVVREFDISETVTKLERVYDKLC